MRLFHSRARDDHSSCDCLKDGQTRAMRMQHQQAALLTRRAAAAAASRIERGETHLYFWVEGDHGWKRHTLWNIIDERVHRHGCRCRPLSARG